LKKLALWIRDKVIDRERRLSDISLQIAYIYRVYDTHPDSYIPIYPQAWIIINQIVPFYRDRRKGDVLKKLARWLRVKVFDSKRTLSDISLQIAYIYRVSDTHPFDIPENWVPHPQQVQIPLHVFITPP